MFCTLWVVAMLSAAAVFASKTPAPTPPGAYILSVTASSDFSVSNVMKTFDPHNVTRVYNSTVYEYYEDTLWGALDSVRGRYFLLTEEALINVYDINTLQLLQGIDTAGITIQLADAMHYDERTDLVWLKYTAEADVANQWCSVVVKTNAFTCYPFDGEYMSLNDASAYDIKSSVIWAQTQTNTGPVLIGFNTATKQNIAPVRMLELCQHMEVSVGKQKAVHAKQFACNPLGFKVAYVKGDTLLLCVEFTANHLVSVDTATGKTTRVTAFPPLADPVENSACIFNHGNGTAASYFVQLQGPGFYTWTEVDVATGAMVANSTTLINNHLPLAFPVYVVA